MSRSDSPRGLPALHDGNEEPTHPGFVRVHGQLHVVTDEDGPIEEPTAPDTWESPLWAQKAAELEMSRRRKMTLLKWLIAGLVAAVFGGFVFGCATSPKPGVVVLSERTGSVVAKLAGALVGQEPKAATLPGGVTVVMQPEDAADTCLVDAHEGTHRVQMAIRGTLAFFTEYEREYRECRAGGYASGWCLRDGMELEREAYQQQHACQAARARGEPWPAVSGRSDRRWWSRCLAKEERR